MFRGIDTVYWLAMPTWWRWACVAREHGYNLWWPGSHAAPGAIVRFASGR